MPGITPDILRYIGEHYDAIVIEGYGVGGLPFQGDQNFLDALETLTRKGKLVVLATQVMLEGSDVEIYEVGVRAVRRYNVLQTYDMTVEAGRSKANVDNGANTRLCRDMPFILPLCAS